MENIKTIIFDFDGTLADCKELHQDGFRAAIALVCPLAVFTDEEVEGRPTREKIRILHAKGYEFNGDKLNQIKQSHTQAHLHEYIIYNVELCAEMHRLEDAGYQLAVASNATELFVHASLDLLQIKDLFVKINTATDFPAKPDTTTFLDIVEYTNSTPETTLIFEDSPVGIQCAIASGCVVISVINSADTLSKLQHIRK